MMTSAEDMNAYQTLTREMTRMHHTERDILDRSNMYRTALDAVINGWPGIALEIVRDMRTDAGDAWRAKQGVTFWGEKI